MKLYLSLLGVVLLAQMGVLTIAVGSGYISIALGLIIILTAVLSFVLIRNLRTADFITFMPVTVFLVAVLLSSGYIVRYLTFPAVMNPSYTQITGFSLILGEFGTIVTSLYIHGRKYRFSLIGAGYEEEEVENALGSHSFYVFLTTLLSVVFAFVIIIVIETTPYLDIGILPALILFGVVYLIVFRFLIIERKREREAGN